MLLPQLPQFWLDKHHCDTFIDIVVCLEHSSVGTAKPSITGYCLCEKDCNGLCGPVTSSADLDGETKLVIASVPCHRVLLSAASSYFSALLGTTWNSGSTNSIRHIPIVLSDVEDVPAMIALLKCIYTSEVNLQASDLASIAAITAADITTSSRSSSSSSSDTLEDVSTQAHLIPAAACSSPPCKSVLQQLQDSFTETCWQELTVRLLRLADQFSVPGALKAAVGKLSCLFSYQLSWPAVLAVLWLPAAVAQQPSLKELRQMAINRVTQDMKHLDPCLASPVGRNILQHLPPDALATLLASDQLALYSENSTLAAIDVWLAGPVASSLAAAADDVTFDHSNAGVTGGDVSSTDSSTTTTAVGLRQPAAAAVGSPRLAAALQLLVRQVRLPLCSGAFLAAAVSQRPWLCLGLQGSHELHLMQQYYRSDSHGRYELAMQLLRSGQSCPWSVMLRRGLPATFRTSSSSIHIAEHSSTSSSGDSSSSSSSRGGAALGLGTYTGLSQIRSLLEWGSGERYSSPGISRKGSVSNSAGDLKTLAQQQQQQQQHGPAAAVAAAAAAGGIVLEERVLGGYFWQLSLVAVPVQDIGGGSSADVAPCGNCGGGAAAADAACTLSDIVQNRHKMLCLSVVCRPAWANELDSSNPEYDATAVSHCCSNSPPPPAAAATGAAAGAGSVQDQYQQQQQQQQEDVAGCCATCDALWTIAGAKAAEAVARHTPITQQLLTTPAALCSCTATGSCADPMQVCNDTTAPAAAAEDSGITDVIDSCSQVQVPGFCRRQGTGCSSSSAAKFAHLDVVVAIQLLAAPSREQLQQQVGDGTAKSGGQSHALTHVPCLLVWDARDGAARAVIPVDVAAIGSGSNVLSQARSAVSTQPAAAAAGRGHPGVAIAAAAGGGGGGSPSAELQGVGVLPGWQPEVWSGLAPGGALYWHCSLRPLMD